MRISVSLVQARAARFHGSLYRAGHSHVAHRFFDRRPSTPPPDRVGWRAMFAPTLLHWYNRNARGSVMFISEPDEIEAATYWSSLQ